MEKVKLYDVQSVELLTNFTRAFSFIAQPGNLPKWTNAFSMADETSALMVTPNGELKIGLKTVTNDSSGVIDWYMTMPDGSVGKAFSRLTQLPDGHVLYSFILLAPPIPIERVEGTLAEQKKILAKELIKLQELLND